MLSEGTAGIDGIEGRLPLAALGALGMVMFGSPSATLGKGVGADRELNVGTDSVGAVIVGPLGVFMFAAAEIPEIAPESWPPYVAAIALSDAICEDTPPIACCMMLFSVYITSSAVSASPRCASR